MAKIYKIALISLLFSILPAIATAATLYFSPSSGSYTVGNNLSVYVYVSSADQAMNAASGIISFPQDKLEATSLSKSSSIFTFWVQEPSFSNSAGTITFEGIVLNPGFAGAAGKIITLTFKVKAAGIAPLSFSSGSVLANDGKGTNILTSLGSAQFSLGGAVPAIPEETTPSIVAGAPSAPQISSPTCPDSNKWYKNKNPEFSWVLPSDVNGVSIYFSESPTSNPGSVADGLFASKSYENVDDGIWYFHIKFRNQYGWGEITHQKVLIDTGSPEPFEIKIQRENSADPQPALIFETTDELSGIEYYEMKIGEGEAFLASSPYKIPSQTPGEHTIVVKAFDKAGNFRSEKVTLTIAPRVLGVLFGEGEGNRLLINFIIALSTIIGILILATFYQWYRFSMERKRLRKETREVDESVRGAFRALREEVQEQIEHLDKKPGLTKEEKEIRDKLQEALNISEEFIGKEIKDVKKELE